jgi:hypothetical protein
MVATYFIYAECLSEDLTMLHYSGIVTSEKEILSQADFDDTRANLASHFGVSDTSRVIIKAMTPLNIAPEKHNMMLSQRLRP